MAENQNIEYKESWRDEFMKWICGFANAQGGSIFIGIDDDHNIVGIEEEAAHRLSEEIPNKVRDLLGIMVDVNLLTENGKTYIELWNEGRLPEGYTIETLLGKHLSKPRNRNIAKVFYRAGFIESWGRGIKKICDGFTAAGFPAPTFSEHCGGVLVEIQRVETKDVPINGGINGGKEGNDPKDDPKDDPKELSARQKLILRFIKEDERVTREEMTQKTGLSDTTIKRDIADLQAKGYLVRVGGRKNGHWEIMK